MDMMATSREDMSGSSSPPVPTGTGGCGMKTWHRATRGLGHVQASSPCQDVTASREENGVTCIALADGAGSAVHSLIGATVVTGETTRVMCRNFSRFYESQAEALNSLLIAHLREKLLLAARGLSAPIGELASTILFVASDGTRYIAGQLGDGCLAYSRGGECKLAAKPEKGEFVNSTVFVTSPSAEKHLKLFKGEIGNIEGFLLMSDGTAESLYQRNTDRVAPLAGRLIRDVFCRTESWLTEIFVPFFEKNILARTRDDCSLAILNTSLNYREFLDKMTEHEIFSLFYKSRRVKRNYLDQYVEILLNVHQTSDMAILAKMVALNPAIVKRRLQNMRKLGFHDVSKFFRA